MVHIFLPYCLKESISVPCPSLTNPSNGMMACLLGVDGTPSYEDTCSFTCNTGYELTGSDTRTCQSDGSWSDSESMCMKGTASKTNTIISIKSKKSIKT